MKVLGIENNFRPFRLKFCKVREGPLSPTSFGGPLSNDSAYSLSYCTSVLKKNTSVTIRIL